MSFDTCGTRVARARSCEADVPASRQCQVRDGIVGGASLAVRLGRRAPVFLALLTDGERR